MPVDISNKSSKEILDQFDTFLLDCDGVIWSGSKVIDGARETLKYLRSQGKRILFVTNNSSNSRVTYAKKFEKLNIEANAEEIFGSAYAAAYYIKHILNFPSDKKVFVIGMEGIQEELTSEGVKFTGGQLDNSNIGLAEMNTVVDDPSIGAVLFGLDININYLKLAKAHTYLNNEHVVFLATNEDFTFPAEGKVLPGTGALLSVLRTSTGRTPTILGKPTQNMLNVIVEKYQLNRERTCMIGDRLDTDILFGQTGGFKTLLVLSGMNKFSPWNFTNQKKGVTSQAVLEQSHTQPDYVLNSLGNFPQN